jgi:SAM-dependent methyltransferase
MTAAPPLLFDRRRWRAARAQAAPGFAAFDFLYRRAFADIVDRLESVNRRFDAALFYGAGDCVSMLTEKAAVDCFALADAAPARLAPMPVPKFAFDEERSALAPARFDLIVSVMTLHATNDLIGALAQYRAALKPDGLFLAALFAEETLSGLRRALYAAETRISGGVSPRIAPFPMLKDLGGAMQRAGFSMPVADLDRMEIRYQEPGRLLEDLKGMGETGFFAPARRPLSRRMAGDALDSFRAGGAVERFDIAYLTGWAPHAGQQKPLKPGSGAQSLEKAVLGTPPS